MNAYPQGFRTPRARPQLVDRELTLGEMLADAIVIRLMQRDGVAPQDVISLFAHPPRGRLCRAA